MSRLSIVLFALLLVAPTALAAAPVDAPAAPDLAHRTLEQTSLLASNAAHATAAGAASTAAALAVAFGAVGHALSVSAIAIGHALATASAALVRAGAAVASAVASVASLLAALVGKGARWVAAHPEDSANAAGAFTGFAWLVWVAKRLGAFSFLAPLYTRLAPSEMLDNEARNSVYEHVKAHPGVHPSAIAENLDLGWGTVVYHLAKLEGGRLVTSRAAHNRKCYFALTSDLNTEARTAVAAISSDKARAIVDAVRAAPGISQKDLSQRLGISQALASWHVKRLVESGVLLVGREGRSHTLRVALHVPMAA